MNKINQFLLPFCLISFCVSLNGQPSFQCNGDFFISLSSSNTSARLHRVTVDPNTNNIVFNTLPQTATGSINAIGYRSTDNYIYGIDVSSRLFYRIDSTGRSIFLANLTSLPNQPFYCGDVTPDGKYWVVLSTNVLGNQSKAHLIDLTTGTYPITTINLRSTSSGGTAEPTGNSADMAFNPYDGLLYAFDVNNRKMITIDINTGLVDDQRFPAVTNSIEWLSSVFFNSFGDLYGYGKLVTTQTDRFFKVDLNTGEINFLTTGPLAQRSDGCSCPYSIELKKTANSPYAFPCTFVKFTFDISNLSGSSSLIDFYDEMDPNFTVVSIDKNPFGGTIVSGVGTNILDIQDMIIPAGQDSLVITVEVGSGPLGIYKNQAKLENLPRPLPPFTLSDDPNTLATKDSTEIDIVPLEIDLPNDTIFLCPGDSALLNASRFGVQYLWQDGSMDSTFNAKSPGVYHVTISSLCEKASDTVIVISPDPWEVSSALDSLRCEDLPSGRIELFAQGGFGAPFSFDWQDDPSRVGPVADNLGPGSYTVVVSDQGGCTYTLTHELALPTDPPFIVFAGNDEQIDLGDSIRLFGQTSPALNGAWSWTPDGPLSCNATCPSPWAKPVNSTRFILSFEDEFGCIISDDVLVLVDKNRSIYTGNAFTPNADGKNDRFYPQGKRISRILTFRIFDRFGGLIFENTDFDLNDYSAGWDGKYGGKYVNPGVYTYLYEAVFIDGHQQFYAGDVTVLRK